MRTKNKELSAHSARVLMLLQNSSRPLTAYEILDRLRGAGVKAPQTVYRALDALVARGEAHRIESLGAFVACHGEEHDHGTHFAVCRSCGAVEELHDHRVSTAIREIGAALKFRVEREMLELLGLCGKCASRSGQGA